MIMVYALEILLPALKITALILAIIALVYVIQYLKRLNR